MKSNMSVTTLSFEVDMPAEEVTRLKETIRSFGVKDIKEEQETTVKVPKSQVLSILRGIEDVKAGRYITSEEMHKKIDAEFEQWEQRQ
ncbi:hypothetical protein [Capnocytophaga haemolytica]|nr:hypothetical protein [Capnocytophaga haemolytica]